MKIQDIMTTPPITVGMDATLRTVKELFDRRRIHHVLVIDEGRLFGVVSDRDLLKALSPNIGTVAESTRDAATLNKRVHQIMSRKPISLPPQAGVMDAVALFNEHRVSCLPVVDPDNRPVGILSWRDIFKALQASRAAH